MHDLQKQASELAASVEQAASKLGIEKLQRELAQLQDDLARPDAWHDTSVAQAKAQRAGSLQQRVDPWVELKRQLHEASEMIALGDESLNDELASQISHAAENYEKLRKELRFSGLYNDHDAILRLSAGAGGTDAQDWAQMLERMYLRWAEKSGYKAEVIERSSGEEAGIKSSAISVCGPFAYGKLQSEHGVHRLVRLSPFNSDNLRQTSFALVEVLPQIDTPDELAINDDDLKIDVYRAGGHGGQSVNTTDSAVRVTHLPTGIVVSIQNERSQLQNKETAMKVLRSKLAQLQLEQHQTDLAKLKGQVQEAAWGNQIRNYVLHPYTMVKDARTRHEDRDAQGVLDGKLDSFIEAYLDRSV